MKRFALPWQRKLPCIVNALFVVLTVAALLLSPAALHAQPLTHPPTGIILPEEIAGFKRTSHLDYEPKQPGLGAGYNYNNGRGGVATIYLFTAGQSGIASGVDSPAMARMREQTLREIVEFAKSRNELTEHLAQRRLTVRTDGGELPILFDGFTITGPAGARETMAMLWGARGHFLKIRMTRMPGGELTDSQMHAFYEFVVRGAAD